LDATPSTIIPGSSDYVPTRQATPISNYKKQMNAIVTHHMESKTRGPQRLQGDSVLPMPSTTVRNAKASARGKHPILPLVDGSIGSFNS
jgi:hypothetical protein